MEDKQICNDDNSSHDDDLQENQSAVDINNQTFTEQSEVPVDNNQQDEDHVVNQPIRKSESLSKILTSIITKIY